MMDRTVGGWEWEKRREREGSELYSNRGAVLQYDQG